MTEKPKNTLSKEERLCGKNAISNLLAGAEFFGESCLKYCYVENGIEINRILISVPKKLFKKAVIRNLLKRRIRESYRKQKSKLQLERSLDILLVYRSKAVYSYEEIFGAIGKILERINEGHGKEEK